ncbi:hypothetical protein CR513_21471, partial [Mucuna pruriens]
MADFENQVKVTAKKAKVSAKKAKKAIVKHGKKAIVACKKGWAKLRKTIKDRQERKTRTEYLGLLDRWTLNAICMLRSIFIDLEHFISTSSFRISLM